MTTITEPPPIASFPRFTTLPITILQHPGPNSPARTIFPLPTFSNFIRAGEFIVRTTLLAVAVALVISILPVSAQAVQNSYPLNVPRQPLDAALKDLARQTGVQIARFSDIPRGVVPVVGPLNGDMSVGQALTAILEKTGLTYKVVNDRTIAVVAPGPGTAESATSSPTKRVSELSADAIGSGEGTDGQKAFWNSFLAAQADQGGASSAPNGDQSRPLQEVLVTANKRTENIQDVPVSVTALSGDQIQLTEPLSLSDLSGLVPGLTIQGGGQPGNMVLTLRGINAPVAGVGSLVGTYIDETPIGSSAAQINGGAFGPDLLPYDLDRIEVLRGPQGTLYGAGSMGGLLKYVLKEPKLDEFSAQFGGVASYIDGSDGITGGVRAAVNLPIIENQLGVRISGYDQHTSGYIHNIGLQDPHYNSYRQQGGRIIGLWTPHESLTIKLSAVIQHSDSAGPASVIVDPYTLQPIGGDFEHSSAVREPFVTTLQLYSFVINWDIGFATLASASSWQRVENELTTDLTAAFQPLVSISTNGAVTNSLVPYLNTTDLKKLTQELRLTSPLGGRLDWMVGAYFTHEDSKNLQPVIAYEPDGVTPVQNINPYYDANIPWSYSETAAFANTTLHVTDQWALSAGVRYARNEQHNTTQEWGAINAVPLNDPTAIAANIVAPPPTYFSSSQGVTTWMVSPEWRPTKEWMLYARVATGYRPGGWSYAPPPLPSAFKADTLTNYELGSKSTFFDSRLILNAAIYDIEWKDIQQNIIEPVTGLTYIGNGKTARSRGGEVEVAYSLTERLRARATVGYTDAKLTADAPGLGGLNGDRIPNIPALNGSLAADYRLPLEGNLQFEAGGAFRFAGTTWTSFESSSAACLLKQPHPLDLYVGLGSAHWGARLYARNVFSSEPHYEQVSDPALFTGGTLTYPPIPPRTVGLSVDLWL